MVLPVWDTIPLFPPPSPLPMIWGFFLGIMTPGSAFMKEGKVCYGHSTCPLILDTQQHPFVPSLVHFCAHHP